MIKRCLYISSVTHEHKTRGRSVSHAAIEPVSASGILGLICSRRIDCPVQA